MYVRLHNVVFNGDYLIQQAKNARFKHAVMSHIPTPSRPEASLGWAAVAIFISIPSTGVMYMHFLGSQSMFFATALVIFVVVSSVNISCYAGYTSWYVVCDVFSI